MIKTLNVTVQPKPDDIVPMGSLKPGQLAQIVKGVGRYVMRSLSLCNNDVMVISPGEDSGLGACWSNLTHDGGLMVRILRPDEKLTLEFSNEEL